MSQKNAKRWLARIGGSWIEAKEPIKNTGSIIVTVESATRGTVSRHALFDDRLSGYERELEVRRAFVRACEELRRALS